MSDSDSVHILDSSPSFQVVVSKKKQKEAVKKRKLLEAAISSASEDESSVASHNAAFYLQMAIDNLNLAATKQTNQSIQAKIQILAEKAQNILVHGIDSELESEFIQSDVQNQLQTIRSEFADKFNQIQTWVSDLKSTAASITTNAAINIASKTNTDTSAINTVNLTQNSSLNSIQNVAEETTYAQALRKPSQSVNENASSSSISANAEKMPATSARSKSKIQHSEKNEKTNSKSNTSFSYRERRLILLESKDSALDYKISMKMRDTVNEEFQKQLKLSATKPVLAAVVKSQNQQNIVLTTMHNYNADFLIQHEKIWQKYFKYAGIYKDKAWHKIVAHGIPTEIFNFAEGIKLLKNEIEIFNGIHPVAVNWLSSSQNRDMKKHCSAVIAFDSEAAANKALKSRLLITNISVRTAKYEEKRTTKQYKKC
jgi:hypothetical protein